MVGRRCGAAAVGLKQREWSVGLPAALTSIASERGALAECCVRDGPAGARNCTLRNTPPFKTNVTHTRIVVILPRDLQSNPPRTIAAVGICEPGWSPPRINPTLPTPRSSTAHALAMCLSRNRTAPAICAPASPLHTHLLNHARYLETPPPQPPAAPETTQ